MIRATRYTKGVGAGLGLRIPSGATWWDFFAEDWAGAESSDTRVTSTERANAGDSAESRYEFSFTPPAGVWDVEIYVLATGETVATGDTLDSETLAADASKARKLAGNTLRVDDATGAVELLDDDDATEIQVGTPSVTDNSTTTTRTKVL